MSEEERLAALLWNIARDGSLRIRDKSEAADLARRLLAAGVRLSTTPEDAPNRYGDIPDAGWQTVGFEPPDWFDREQLRADDVTTKAAAYLVSAAMDWAHDYGAFEVNALVAALAAVEAEVRAATPEPEVVRLRKAAQAVIRLHDEAGAMEGGAFVDAMDAAVEALRAALAGHESTESPRPIPGSHGSPLGPDGRLAEPPRPEPLDVMPRLRDVQEFIDDNPVAEPPREDPEPQYPDTFDDLAGDPTSPPR